MTISDQNFSKIFADFFKIEGNYIIGKFSEKKNKAGRRFELSFSRINIFDHEWSWTQLNIRVQTILELSNQDEEDYLGTYAKKFPTSKLAH